MHASRAHRPPRTSVPGSRPRHRRCRTARTNELVSGQATFTTRSAAVIVDVVARDRQNRPILDLRKDEFEVFEDGKRQDITYFEPVGLATTPGATTSQPIPEMPRPPTPARTEQRKWCSRSSSCQRKGGK